MVEPTQEESIDAAKVSAATAKIAAAAAKTDWAAVETALGIAVGAVKKAAVNAALTEAKNAKDAANTAADEAESKVAEAIGATTDTEAATAAVAAASFAAKAMKQAEIAGSARKVAEDIVAPTPRGPMVGTGTPVETPALNQQIVQAVDKSNQVVLGAATTEANGIAYQKVAQAAAFSVQDSTDYLRNIMTIAATAQGVCLKLMITEKENIPTYTDIMVQAQKAVIAAQANFAAVGADAGTVVSNFPSA